ncbi:lytic murein transglycosylase [Flexibacterium corallicola]|uniref:lytic murein transglycosylase n=1 Tax=Flexibacterium corallicola TaxID=3037259 RepID=UPI00286F3247|nr:lytic murein transglycosylase [Pseudovibrio sp. M1P-2-3]
MQVIGVIRAALGALFVGSILVGQAAAAPAFDRWVEGFWPQARSAGISRSLYTQVFKGMTPDPEILRRAENQPEFTQAVWSYLDRAVSDRRIKNGTEAEAEWSAWLDTIEKRYGVSRYTVVAIWGMESSYGHILDNPKIVRGTIRSLATLAYDGGKRKKFGRTQLIAALKILQNGDVHHSKMTGSWAGAMGHTQFIPTTYQAYAVDITGDGKRDIWNSVPDALASTAAYLKASGWETGKTWGYEVQLPSGFNYALANKKSARSLGEWETLGITRANGSAFPRKSDHAKLYLPAGSKGPAFLTLKNFDVIKRYNNSNSYALAVGHLGDRILGVSSFQASWPRNDTPLSFSERKQLQQLLSRNGYPVGKIDGRIGPGSQSAIRKYQLARGMTPDGYDSKLLLERLKREN